MSHEVDLWHIQRALELAAQGQGAVEPNPMVGCVIARGAEMIGEGWHRRFGGPHAEIEALKIAGDRAKGATMYVTLEPCCHHGKTPPCTQAILAAGIQRVVAAMTDPFPQVAGGGLNELRQAGVEITTDICRQEAEALNAPYLKLIRTGKPWVIAKWAMTLDGKIATHTGDSRWISNEKSRSIVHRLRGRVDAVVVGINTAERDDPLLNARPAGQRTATRIVLDTQARLSLKSKLVQTAREIPVLVAVGEGADAKKGEELRAAGCETIFCAGGNAQERWESLLSELGNRRMTNILVEGGGQVLGTLLDARSIDEVHAFIAPKLLGGATAPFPMAGKGVSAIAEAIEINSPQIESLDGDLYLHGRVK